MEDYAWVIEFRSGLFYVNEDAETGGPIKLAKLWPSVRVVDDFVTRNEWILWNGGCPIPVCRLCRKRPMDRSVPCRCSEPT